MLYTNGHVGAVRYVESRLQQPARLGDETEKIHSSDRAGLESGGSGLHEPRGDRL